MPNILAFLQNVCL